MISTIVARPAILVKLYPGARCDVGMLARHHEDDDSCFFIFGKLGIPTNKPSFLPLSHPFFFWGGGFGSKERGESHESPNRTMENARFCSSQKAFWVEIPK